MSQTVIVASDPPSQDPGPARVSPADREAFSRQVSALIREESDDEGTADLRSRRIGEADADRARRGIPPLKTEPELHRRARDLGLLGR